MAMCFTAMALRVRKLGSTSRRRRALREDAMNRAPDRVGGSRRRSETAKDGRSVRARALLTWVGLMLAGCGGAPPRPDPDHAFARIQVHEATIAHRAAEARACAGTPPCPAAEAVCAASDALCDIARRLDDGDAWARCATARRACPREAG